MSFRETEALKFKYYGTEMFVIVSILLPYIISCDKNFNEVQKKANCFENSKSLI